MLLISKPKYNTEQTSNWHIPSRSLVYGFLLVPEFSFLYTLHLLILK